MRIGIIGAGQIGGTLTRRLAALGHDVRVANSRGPASLATLAEETGARAVSVRDAVRDVDVVIISIPEIRVLELPPRLFDGASDDLIVVDTGNYFPRERDGCIGEIEAGMTESAWVARRIGRRVVKAFNNIGYKSLMERGLPAGSPGRIALPVAGDRYADIPVVRRLVDELGYDAIDAGSIEDSWRQQPGTPAFATDLDAEGLRHALRAASPERRTEFRGTRKASGMHTASA